MVAGALISPSSENVVLSAFMSSPRTNRVVIGLGLAMGLLIWTLIVFFACTRPSLRIIQRWPQDPAVSYDGAQYMVAIYEDGTDWSAFPLSLPATYSIYVGRASETIDYGHRIRFSFDHGVDPIETQSAETSVEWVPRGVWIRPPSGHQLFVPVNMFTGGR